MVGWRHWLNGHEFEQALGDCERQGSLAYCSPCPDTTERLIATNEELWGFLGSSSGKRIHLQWRKLLFDSWVGKFPWRRHSLLTAVFLGFPCGSDGKESTCNAGDLGSLPGLGRSPGGGHGNPLQYSCLENPHGQMSLMGYSPQGHKDSDMHERLSTAQHIRNYSSGKPLPTIPNPFHPFYWALSSHLCVVIAINLSSLHCKITASLFLWLLH